MSLNYYNITQCVKKYYVYIYTEDYEYTGRVYIPLDIPIFIVPILGFGMSNNNNNNIKNSNDNFWCAHAILRTQDSNGILRSNWSEELRSFLGVIGYNAYRKGVRIRVLKLLKNLQKNLSKYNAQKVRRIIEKKCAATDYDDDDDGVLDIPSSAATKTALLREVCPFRAQ